VQYDHPDSGKHKSFIIAHARDQDGGMNRIRLIGRRPHTQLLITLATKGVEEVGGNGKKEEVLRILDRLRAMHHVYNEPSQALGGDWSGCRPRI
jgi:hypothetical protein